MSNSVTSQEVQATQETGQAAPMSFLEEVERVRSEIASASDELEFVMNSPLPKAEAKKRLAAAFQRASADLRLPVWQFTEPNAGIHTLTDMLAPDTGQHGEDSAAGRRDFIELIMVLLGDELLTSITSKIDALSYTAGPPGGERDALAFSLKRTLRTLGIEEERLICEAINSGVFIPRRADADPAIVLNYLT